MKQLYPNLKQKDLISLKSALLAIALLFAATVSFSQELVFRNPSLVSGSAGADGAVYKFSNVANNLDALVTISGRSSSLVNLDTVDVTSTGFDKAFQPLVSYNGGSANGPISWWMEFEVTFVRAGTTSPMLQDTVNATAIDIDGDGVALQEQFTAFNPAKCTMNNPTSLSMCAVSGGGEQFTGPINNSAGIDTLASKNMVTQTYLSANSVRFRYGAVIQGSGCNAKSNATARYNSIWFKSFAYAGGTLPMQLVSFDAQLDNSNGKALLSWSTVSEINASNFVVQRSTDGSNYEDVALVFTQEGNSNNVIRQYAYADNVDNLNSPIVYYRLKMVDLDGKFAYSAIDLIRLAKEGSQAGIVVFPNPVQNQLRITIPDNWQSKMVSYSIYNAAGSLVRQMANSNAGQTQTMDISSLPMGVYFVKASNGNATAVQRIIKSNN